MKRAVLLLPIAAMLGACASRQGLPPEPAVERHVAEDDQVRIAELKVRGQAKEIKVEIKAENRIGPVKTLQYEIVPITPARDPSKPGQTGGQRVWTFEF